MSNADRSRWVWAERFRPEKLDDVVIPESVKTQFKKFLEDKELPNLLLTSTSPGTGKTTTAYALCNELGIKPLFINASLNNSIDDIRMTVMQYATTMSLYGSDTHKVIILDEGDRLTANAQDALKGIIEQVHKNCRFIITANNKNKIIEPLQSRLTNIEFRFTKTESDKMMAQMLKRVFNILDETATPYGKAAVAGIVKVMFPDNRSLLTFLQIESKLGQIDEGSLAKASASSPEALIEAMKAKKYKDVQNFIINNADRLSEDFYERLFKMLEPQISEQTVPQLVLILGEYQKYDAIVPSKYIHYLAMCTEIMMQISIDKKA
jgi:DNA polymerase III delta prime subunit